MSKFLSISLIVILSLLAYSNSLTGDFLFDDYHTIVKNYQIKNIYDLNAIWSLSHFRFVTNLSFALNYHISKLDPFWFHLTNLMIHISSAITLYILGRFLLKASQVGQNDKLQHLPFISALLFAVHPIQTEAVSYISQRYASLATLLYLLTLVLYLKFRLSFKNSQIGFISQLIKALTFLAFCFSWFLATLSKEISLTIPLSLFALELLFLRKKTRINTSDITSFLLLISISSIFIFFNRFQISWSGSSISPINYFFTQMNVIPTYLRLLVLPINQNLDYDFPISHSINIQILLSFCFLLILLFSAIKLYKVDRFLSFGIFFFLFTLVPESSFFPLRDVIFEHRLYLPLAGFSIAVAALFIRLTKLVKPIYTILPFLILIVMSSWLTYRRNFVWQNNLTLWSDVVSKSPNKARAHEGLGFSYFEQNKFDLAISQFKNAAQLDPNYDRAYSNLGTIYEIQGRDLEAEGSYIKAFSVNSQNNIARRNLAALYVKHGRLDEAQGEYKKALQVNPFDAKAENGLGIIFYKQGRYEEAKNHFQKAISLDPDYPDAYFNLGLVFEQTGQSGTAKLYFEKNKSLNLEKGLIVID